MDWNSKYATHQARYVLASVIFSIVRCKFARCVIYVDGTSQSPFFYLQIHVHDIQSMLLEECGCSSTKALFDIFVLQTLLHNLPKLPLLEL